MTIEIKVDIPDEVAHMEDDGFGQPSRRIARKVMAFLRTDPRYFSVTNGSVVDVAIPEIMSRGLHYGDTK
ncbi:hypothetical protein [Curtobacterium sp. MCSS17_011]|uniref:hypothetical protein n=1 Tax=Curtobacterium sp. MCSS17_011 TaxID=2175643 RepID=UPI0011B3A766|nr:hypothetical protein [Curtobacterium sp. MCSS17_011]